MIQRLILIALVVGYFGFPVRAMYGKLSDYTPERFCNNLAHGKWCDPFDATVIVECPSGKRIPTDPGAFCDVIGRRVSEDFRGNRPHGSSFICGNRGRPGTYCLKDSSNELYVECPNGKRVHCPLNHMCVQETETLAVCVPKPLKPDPVSVLRPGPAFDPVQVSDPVSVLRPGPAFDPVQVSDPVSVPRPGPAFDPVQVSDPISVPRPGPAFDPVQVSDPISVPRPGPAFDPVQVSDPASVPRSGPAFGPVQVSDPVPTSEPSLSTATQTQTKSAAPTKAATSSDPLQVFVVNRNSETEPFAIKYVKFGRKGKEQQQKDTVE